MIDIKTLRSNPKAFKDSAKLRGISVDIDRLLELDGERSQLLQAVEGLRAKLNLKGKPTEAELKQLQDSKAELEAASFTLMGVPHLVNSRIAAGTGFSPRGEESQVYKVEDEDLNLIATAEIPLTGYHADEILASESLPLLYAGLSPAYRREA